MIQLHSMSKQDLVVVSFNNKSFGQGVQGVKQCCDILKFLGK
jgi:hypothetical protein